MVSWDPTTYLDFAAERARPFRDLLARVAAAEPRSVVDLGCGPGGLTRELARRWPAAQVRGIDSSPEMIARATADASQFAVNSAVDGSVTFEVADLRSWRPAEPVDVIVTNATLQWVPGHLDLLAGWVETALAPGGWLALQVPGNLADPLHTLLRELTASSRWADQLGDAEQVRAAVPDPVGYAEVLAGAGCRVDAWETTYLHLLDPEGRFGDDAVLAWALGTALRPLLDRLTHGSDETADRAEFLTAYAERLRAAYPRRSFGTPLPFRRVFAVAQRPA